MRRYSLLLALLAAICVAMVVQASPTRGSSPVRRPSSPVRRPSSPVKRPTVPVKRPTKPPVVVKHPATPVKHPAEPVKEARTHQVLPQAPLPDRLTPALRLLMRPHYLRVIPRQVVLRLRLARHLPRARSRRLSTPFPARRSRPRRTSSACGSKPIPRRTASARPRHPLRTRRPTLSPLLLSVLLSMSGSLPASVSRRLLAPGRTWRATSSTATLTAAT
ncbi:hypothetical protein EXIGLDRAFT_491947 [Exidia glandulosa HHB12029]|uniref:Uncharacterized protein n=1 Tax=Exidia glandulosa HHB12029 TaxID=1314781 RepID=A0A165JL54_EXIGL|nr:hypothetical protein EXIGLDRAFT_491947 [Exidia glandulosa HHB12029]